MGSVWRLCAGLSAYGGRTWAKLDIISFTFLFPNSFKEPEQRNKSRINMSIDILHLEDDPRDMELVEAMLLAADMDCQIVRVQSCDEYDAALRKQGFDVILGDYRLPGYDGISALRLAQELCPDIPFVFVSGTMGEDAAIEGLTQGATDYVLKQRLSRLVPAIKRALSEAENRRERKHAEDALKESAERFRAVAESANEGIISADSHGMIIYWNRAAREIFGYLQEEIIGQPLSVLMPKMWADQQHHHNDPWEFGDEPLQSSSIQETVGYRKDGSKFPIEFSIGNWNTRQGAFFTVMARDETARKQAEENLRLQSAASKVANGIMISIERKCNLGQLCLPADRHEADGN
jgi:PAS domain S-box-containing protein